MARPFVSWGATAGIIMMFAAGLSAPEAADEPTGIWMRGGRLTAQAEQHGNAHRRAASNEDSPRGSGACLRVRDELGHAP